MRFEYDEDADAAYIYIKQSIKKGEVKKTIALNDNIIIDFDKNDKLIGVEILGASKILSRSVIEKSSDIVTHTVH